MRLCGIRILILIFALRVGWAQSIPDTLEGVKRIIAIGDLHADYDRFVIVLRQAGLADENKHWTGGVSHLVLCGDLIDRGPRSMQVLDLVMALEKEASRSGGRVHALIGNHEAMNMEGDFRYVSPEDFATFQTGESEHLRQEELQAALASLRFNGREPADIDAWTRQYLAEHPLGWAERRRAFLPDGKYGKWLRKHNAVVKINEALYMHGGLSEKYMKRSLKEINERIRSELDHPVLERSSLANDEQGPLWFRGLIQTPEDDEAARRLVARILEEHGVRHVVVGHTPNPAPF